MTGKDILQDKKFIEAFDEVEASAITKIDEVFKGDENEITEEESNRCELIADYKYKAQEHIETAYLYFKRLKEV